MPSGKAMVLHSLKNIIGWSFSFETISNMSWFCYRRAVSTTDFLGLMA